MSKQLKILGESRVVQYADGNAKVQISKDLDDDLSMNFTFLAMNIEVLASKLDISIEEVFETIRHNIEIEPMMFEQDEER